jgi:D-amino-acid oxidase
MIPVMGQSFLITGAGVIGLTTAIELRVRYPSVQVIIVANYLPGDSAQNTPQPGTR